MSRDPLTFQVLSVHKTGGGYVRVVSIWRTTPVKTDPNEYIDTVPFSEFKPSPGMIEKPELVIANGLIREKVVYR